MPKSIASTSLDSSPASDYHLTDELVLILNMLTFNFLRRPNEALLSINCFQKDLSDANPLVRAWALRAMSGIRLHTIAPIVLVAFSKCAKDPSSYVRKCTANSLSKLNDLLPVDNAPALEEVCLLYF